MSNALARLRKLLGEPLLVREGLTLVPTPPAEALRQPVRDALAIIRGALDAPAGFDPAADRATCTVSCSDYSLLMLIGPLVRRLAATAPGVTIRVLPRLPDPVRLIRDGTADLVTVVPERAVPHLRRTADIRVLEPPVALPAITQTQWWHPRHTASPAHAWIRACIAEIAAELDQSPAGV
jgi:DNA-binding transcriptional LysR family regulator